ncbi:MAG: hypothetical protein U0235_02695 [Polyangiaceae bacterium]
MTVEKTNDLLVLTFDGKGIPMRREDLEGPETRKAVESTPPIAYAADEGE